jgi:NosL
MTFGKVHWMPLLVGLIVVVGLPLVGRWARWHSRSGCAFDGGKIDPSYRVAVVDARGNSHDFCCIRCAQCWLRRQPAPLSAITVTDEASGEMIAAATAWYVRSTVVTMPMTQNRVHVFRNKADAETNAAGHGGRLLSEAELPFREGIGSPLPRDGSPTP